MTTGVRVIKDFFGEYREAKVDHRDQRREPFFRPAKVICNGRSYEASTRDVSSGGVGLLHNAVIPTGPAEVEIELHTGGIVKIDVLVLWCHCEGRRFLSGAIFLQELPTKDGRLLWPSESRQNQGGG